MSASTSTSPSVSSLNVILLSSAARQFERRRGLDRRALVLRPGVDGLDVEEAEAELEAALLLRGRRCSGRRRPSRRSCCSTAAGRPTHSTSEFVGEAHEGGQRRLSGREVRTVVRDRPMPADRLHSAPAVTPPCTDSGRPSRPRLIGVVASIVSSSVSWTEMSSMSPGPCVAGSQSLLHAVARQEHVDRGRQGLREEVGRAGSTARS